MKTYQGYVRPEARRNIEQGYILRLEAFTLLDLIVIEATTYPSECLGPRIVERARVCVASYKALPEYAR